MRISKIGRFAPALLVAALALSGCPTGPTGNPALNVTPPAVNIPESATAGSFQLTNTGAGTLEWTVTEDLPWLQLSEGTSGQQGDSITGTTTNTLTTIQMTVDRYILPEEETVIGVVAVTSNGGDAEVRLSVSRSFSAELNVTQTSIDFGLTELQESLPITNGGRQNLSYTVTVPKDAPWLEVTPAMGTIGASGVNTLTFTVDRGRVATTTATAVVRIASNGGDATITASVQVPALLVTPEAIDFGQIVETASQIVTIANNGSAPETVTLDVSTDSGGGWLTVDFSSATVPAADRFEVRVTADTTGLTPARYTGDIMVRNATGEEQNIPVAMEITGFRIDTEEIDFGTIDSTSTRTFTISNIGQTAIPWSTEIPPADQDFLQVEPPSGTVEPGATDTLVVTLIASEIDPGPEASTIRVLHEGTQDVIDVSVTRPRPAALTVSPRLLDFGVSKQDALVGLWNDGVGTVNWRIATAGFPPWLSLEPVNGSIASGSVSGDVTDTITVMVDRSQLPEGVERFESEILVEASGDSNEDRTITVIGQAPLVPVFELESDGVDQTGIPFLTLDIDEDERTFVIRNAGDGRLEWNFTGPVPDFIIGLQPERGTLEPGIQQTITVAIDREPLGFGGEQALLQIESNDPDNQLNPLTVEVLVEAKPAITVRPSGGLAFGPFAILGTIEVANSGDPATELEFRLTTSKDWLAVFPDAGTSIAPPPGIPLDFQPSTVTVDRSRLDANGSSGRIIVNAVEVVNGEIVPREDIEPVEIEVSVEAAPLTIETPLPFARPPSIIRFPILLRDKSFASIQLAETSLPSIARQFRISEQDQALELTETNQFLRASVSGGSGTGSRGARLLANTMILLDYSGSMQASAQQLVEDGQLEPSDDPLQDLYEQTIPSLIDDLPPNHRITLAAFNERDPQPGDVLRIIAESPQTREEIKEALDDFAVIDNGASELLPAVLLGAQRIAATIADVRALICVTDGRLTTTPTMPQDFSFSTVANMMSQALRVQFYPVGWGEEVLAGQLIQLSAETGGHYYSTANRDTGRRDAFGQPIRVPQLSELLDWTQTDPDDPCDQSIGKDLASILVLSYITLNVDSSVAFQAALTFNDPTDGPRVPGDPSTVCLPEQGEISGDFSQNLVGYDALFADSRQGQVNLRTDGLQDDDTALVIARSPYIPRNLTEFAVELEVLSQQNQPIPGAVIENVSPVVQADGGLIYNWDMTQNGNTYTFNSPDGTPLQFGDFGDLLDIDIANVAGPFRLAFEIVSPVFNSLNPESKFFTHPSAMPVSFFEDFAPALPSPAIGVDQFEPVLFNTLQFPLVVSAEGADSITLFFFNVGGGDDRDGPLPAAIPNSDEPQAPDQTLLEYFLDDFIAPIGFDEPFPQEGTVAGILEPGMMTFPLDRDVEPGTYEAEVQLRFEFGSLLGETLWNEPENPPIILTYEVGNPQLAVTPNNLAFGAATTELPLTISNPGESTLEATIDDSAFPPWLRVDAITVFAGAGASTELTVEVLRDNLPAGPNTFTFTVEGAGSSADVTVTAEG